MNADFEQQVFRFVALAEAAHRVPHAQRRRREGAGGREDRVKIENLGVIGRISGAGLNECLVEETLDSLADHLKGSLDLDALLSAAQPPRVIPGG